MGWAQQCALDWRAEREEKLSPGRRFSAARRRRRRRRRRRVGRDQCDLDKLSVRTIDCLHVLSIFFFLC